VVGLECLVTRARRLPSARLATKQTEHGCNVGCLGNGTGRSWCPGVGFILPGAGVGSALLGAVEKVAADHGGKRVVVITSNDNLSALRFYQLRGYRMVAVRVGAIDAARESKPTIPAYGLDGIPIHDELELIKPL
jgi:hypothetical protein